MTRVRVIEGNYASAHALPAPKNVGRRGRMTADQVREIRHLMAKHRELLAAAKQLDARAIGKMYGIHWQQVNKIAKRRQWSRVP